MPRPRGRAGSPAPGDGRRGPRRCPAPPSSAPPSFITTFMSVSAWQSSAYSRSSTAAPPTMPTETAATCAVQRAALIWRRQQQLAGAPGDVAAGDRRGAGAAVGLQHVAIQGDGALAERLQVHHRAQLAADQALDLRGAAGLLAAVSFARRRVWVARGSMPYSAVTQPLPEPRRKPGTRFLHAGVHSTWVSPKSPAPSLPRVWCGAR